MGAEASLALQPLLPYNLSDNIIRKRLFSFPESFSICFPSLASHFLRTLPPNLSWFLWLLTLLRLGWLLLLLYLQLLKLEHLRVHLLL
jgi:hypothetical protein